MHHTEAGGILSSYKTAYSGVQVEVFGSSNSELPCLSRLNVDDQNDAIPREEVTRAI
jgi:hypothetical protein